MKEIQLFLNLIIQLDIFYLYENEKVMVKILLEKNRFCKIKKTFIPTAISGPTSIFPLAVSLTYIKTGGSDYSQNVFVSFERTDKVQISIISFLAGKSQIMQMFGIQLIKPNEQG